MITSYGSDESDSDTADENHSKSEAPVSATEATSTSSITKPKSIEVFPSSAPVLQPQLPTTSQNLDQECKSIVEDAKAEVPESKSTEEKEAKYLKSQPLPESEECRDKGTSDNRTVNESKVTVTKKSNSKHIPNCDLDFRVSLVPGYDEDSDVDEELEVKQEKKALFPIPQTEDTVEILPLAHRTVQSKHPALDNSRVTDSNDSDVNAERRSEQENEGTSESTECGEEPAAKAEDDGQRANKFLDNLHGRSKFFQRKKRIAFDGRGANVLCRLMLFGLHRSGSSFQFRLRRRR